MKIPKRINILGHPVTIYHTSRPIEVEDDLALGAAHILTNKIGICYRVEDEYIAESMKAEALMHEIFHHINTKLALDLKENQIQGMALGAIQVIRDNHLNFLDTEDAMGKKQKKGKKGAAPVVGKGKKCK